jgi:hypothetical protein
MLIRAKEQTMKNLLRKIVSDLEKNTVALIMLSAGQQTIAARDTAVKANHDRYQSMMDAINKLPD